MTEGLPEGEQPVIPEGYTEEVARYVGDVTVKRGTEQHEWRVPEAPAEETPTPTIEEEDTAAADFPPESE